MQRQSRSAFDSLMSFRGYEAWVLLRPCLEAGLIVGKWSENSDNAKTWLNREKDPKPYRREYTGKALRSQALPRSDAIQGVLKLVNDQFVHANPDYYRRHADLISVDTENAGIRIEYTEDPEETEAHTYAILHVLLILQESLLVMLRRLISGVQLETLGLTDFEGQFQPRVDKFLKREPRHREFLNEFGLWPSAST